MKYFSGKKYENPLYLFTEKMEYLTIKDISNGYDYYIASVDMNYIVNVFDGINCENSMMLLY